MKRAPDAFAQEKTVPEIDESRIAQLAARLHLSDLTAPAGFAGGPTQRARAAAMRARMARFPQIYNAGYMVRYSQHGAPERRERRVKEFVAALVDELEKCKDYEALIFAVADTLTADPHGVPWEG